MAEFTQFQLNNVFQQALESNQPRRAWTGKLNSDGEAVTGADELEYPDLQVWVRVGSPSADASVAWDLRGRVTHNAPNMQTFVELDVNGDLQISDRTDNRALATQFGSLAPQFTRNRLAVGTSELRPLLYSVSDMELTVSAYAGDFYFINSKSIDLTDYVPSTSGVSEWVLIYLDPYGGNNTYGFPALQAVASGIETTINAAHPRDVTLIYRPAYAIPVAGVLLTNGDTEINPASVTDARQFINNPRRRAVLRHVEDLGINGGASVAGTWNDCKWTPDETSDPTSALVLDEDNATFRLAPGDWRVDMMIALGGVNDSKLRIYNVTQSTVIEESMTERGFSPALRWVFDVSANGTDEFKLQIYTQSTAAAGLGVSQGRGDQEVYAKAVFTNI